MEQRHTGGVLNMSMKEMGERACTIWAFILADGSLVFYGGDLFHCLIIQLSFKGTDPRPPLLITRTTL